MSIFYALLFGIFLAIFEIYYILWRDHFMNPEKRFELKIGDKLALQGWWSRHFDTNGLDGWPDIAAFKDRECRLIEVKAGTKVSPEQRAFHKMLGMFGVHVFVIEAKGTAVILDGEVYATLEQAIQEIVK